MWLQVLLRLHGRLLRRVEGVREVAEFDVESGERNRQGAGLPVRSRTASTGGGFCVTAAARDMRVLDDAKAVREVEIERFRRIDPSTVSSRWMKLALQRARGVSTDVSARSEAGRPWIAVH